MNDTIPHPTNGAQAEKLVYFPRADGSGIPLEVYSCRHPYKAA
jgi:hypothetical protein